MWESMDPNILKTLLVYNPWLENPSGWGASVNRHLPQAIGHPYIPRFADVSATWPQRRKINLVIGPRQCGKSTLIWHTLAGMPPKVIYINGNELGLRQWCASPGNFWVDIEQLMLRPEVLFFEEVQYIENAGLFLKGLVDLRKEVMVFATGSSSFHLHDKIRESLAGRAERITLFPFSLAEWAKEGAGRPKAIYEKQATEKFERSLIFGSYPEVCFNDRPDLILNSLVEAFVIRDASDVFHIKYPDKLRKLLSLMATQIGNLVNFSDWANLCGIDVKTTESYANILEESHIIKLLRPYAGGKRAEITSTPKVFFVDNGIRNLMVHQFNDFEFRADKGPLFENWLFSELIKNSEYNDLLYYWRSKGMAEVDFIRQRGDRLEAFEAKASRMDRPRLTRSAKSFIDGYAPNIFYVVNLSLDSEEMIGRTLVRWIPPLEFVGEINKGRRP